MHNSGLMKPWTVRLTVVFTFLVLPPNHALLPQFAISSLKAIHQICSAAMPQVRLPAFLTIGHFLLWRKYVSMKRTAKAHICSRERTTVSADTECLGQINTKQCVPGKLEQETSNVTTFMLRWSNKMSSHKIISLGKGIKGKQASHQMGFIDFFLQDLSKCLCWISANKHDEQSYSAQ